MKVENNNVVPASTDGHVFIDAEANISEVASTLSSSLSEAINQHAETLILSIKETNSLGFEQIVFAIFIVIVGAFSAFAFNFLHWHYANKMQKYSNLGKSLRIIIEDLEQISIDYWIRGYDKELEQEIQVKEAVMKSKILLIDKYSTLFMAGLIGPETKHCKDALAKFKAQIFELATGGNFESKMRAPSKDKALKIARECGKINAQLMSVDCIN